MKSSKPFYVLERDGVTQGLLTMFQQCRQKARWFLEGWSPRAGSMGLTYGSIGHEVLERVYTSVQKGHSRATSPSYIKCVIAEVEKDWKQEHKRADKKALEYMELSLLLAEATLPIYFDYWRKDVQQMKWKALETDFCVPFQFGKVTIPVRGKRDGLYYRAKALWLMENKFKSKLDEDALVDMLTWDLQCCLYTWATWQELKQTPGGVLYNMIKRVGLRQGKKETIQAFAKRCVEDIRQHPAEYFSRLEVSLSRQDIQDWEKEFEGMLRDFVAWLNGQAGHYRCSHHCLNKYGKCEYLPLCSSRAFYLFEKRDKVFRELEDY